MNQFTTLAISQMWLVGFTLGLPCLSLRALDSQSAAVLLKGARHAVADLRAVVRHGATARCSPVRPSAVLNLGWLHFLRPMSPAAAACSSCRCSK